MSRIQRAFLALILAQAAHSTEEYLGRLWESFPPVRLVSGLISPDLERNFLILNLLLVGFGLWCVFWPVRRGWPSAPLLGWIWVTVELINGLVHPLWSLRQGGYTPGVATAPLLLVLSLNLAYRLGRSATPSAASAQPPSKNRSIAGNTTSGRS